jgi:hypothetical protein
MKMKELTQVNLLLGKIGNLEYAGTPSLRRVQDFYGHRADAVRRAFLRKGLAGYSCFGQGDCKEGCDDGYFATGCAARRG